MAATVAATLGLALPSQAPAEQPLTLSVPTVIGEHRVGTRSFQLVDRSRPAGFGQAGRRRLMVQVTYPLRSNPRVRCREAAYLPPATQAKLLGFIGVSKPVDPSTGACAGGPVARGRHPLLLFSHAYTADRAVYSTLTYDLASRGYVVASVDHTYDAFAVEFPGGELVDGLFGSPLSSKRVTVAQLEELLEVRVADVRFATTRLLRESRRERSWLSGRIDRRRIGALGHSLGGATAVGAASLDRRFRVASDVDGSLYGPWAEGGIGKPFLLLMAEEGLGSVLPRDDACPFYGSSTGPKAAWQLDGAAHLSFSDFQSLAPQVAAEDPSWPFASLYPAIVGELDPAASVLAQRQALARFFDRYLRRPAARSGKARPLPAPPAGISPASAAQLACE